jgi:hypothetical protein
MRFFRSLYIVFSPYIIYPGKLSVLSSSPARNIYILTYFFNVGAQILVARRAHMVRRRSFLYYRRIKRIFKVSLFSPQRTEVSAEDAIHTDAVSVSPWPAWLMTVP